MAQNLGVRSNNFPSLEVAEEMALLHLIVHAPKDLLLFVLMNVWVSLKGCEYLTQRAVRHARTAGERADSHVGDSASFEA